MAAKKPLKKKVVKKPIKKKVVKKPIEKKVVRKAPVRKVAKKGAASDTTTQKVIGAFYKAFDGFGLTPPVILGIGAWLLFVLKYAIFYDK